MFVKPDRIVVYAVTIGEDGGFCEGIKTNTVIILEARF